MTVAIGDRFRVSEIHTVKDRRDRLLANYRPEFVYRVTPKNISIVAQLIEAGKASIDGKAAAPVDTGASQQIASSPAKVRGFVSVKPKGKR